MGRYLQTNFKRMRFRTEDEKDKKEQLRLRLRTYQLRSEQEAQRHGRKRPTLPTINIPFADDEPKDGG